MYTYDTMTEAINGLKKRGYTVDFNIAFDRIICSDNKHILEPADFEITEMHRFEGFTNPADEDVLYAVESKKGNIKGIITSAFGPYADNVSAEMISKLSIHK